MILYLSSSQNTNLLDFERWRTAENQLTPVKKMVGNFALKKFVVHDMRNFSHLTEIVLDRIAFTDTDGEFAEAVQEFLTMYEARITVIYEGLTSADGLYQELIACGVGNLVCSSEIREIQQELTECFRENGMERYLAAGKRREKREWYSFECRNISIVVTSSQARMGATTAAIGLCSWLSKVGATVAYIEANESRHLYWLAKSYGMEKTEQGYDLEAVQYGNGHWTGEVNFIVYDVGTFKDADWEVILSADLKVLLCGSKPYELRDTMLVKKQLLDWQIFILCPFTAEGMRQDIGDLLVSEQHQVLFPEYQPEIMDGTVNRTVFKRIITKYIAGV